MLREVSEEEAVPRHGLGIVPTNFATQGPKTVPRVDYERIFILDEQAKPVGEYALRDNCPLEYEDLQRSIPASGMRHLLSFFQGEYVFTPFRVENLWFVVLTHGVPRIEERGSIGTLLAAMRAHLPASLVPTLAEKELALRERERDLERRESLVSFREERALILEADVQIAGTKVRELETGVRAREMRLDALRDYALEMQRAFRPSVKSTVPDGPEENPAPPDATASPPP
ncbi:MAG TPA: hypothetical protein VEO20_06865 [Thermoplasmata archaeon]|nr:hypothetical protein [Thermoplasmata archaeon]